MAGLQSGFVSGAQAAQEMQTQQMETQLQQGQLGLSLHKLDLDRQKMQQDIATKATETAQANFVQLTGLVTTMAQKNGAIPRTSAIFDGYLMAAKNLAKSYKNSGGDPENAMAMYDTVVKMATDPNAGLRTEVSQGTRIMQPGPNNTTVDRGGVDAAAPEAIREAAALFPGNQVAQRQYVLYKSQKPITKIDIPGENGTTTFMQGGQTGMPPELSAAVNGGQPSHGAPTTPLTGAQALEQQSPSTIPAGGPTAAPLPGGGQSGKVMPHDAQQTVTSGLTMLDALGTMEKNIKQSGIVAGRVNNAMTAVGAGNRGAIDFDTAKNNLTTQAQAIIKGTPSDFDIQAFQKTLPDLTLPENVNKARIDFTRKMVTQLVEDTISYHKYTGTRIPPDIAARAKKFGVNVDSVQAWNGQGSSTAKSTKMLMDQIGGAPAQGSQQGGAVSAKDHPGARLKGSDGKVYVSKDGNWVAE